MKTPPAPDHVQWAICAGVWTSLRCFSVSVLVADRSGHYRECVVNADVGSLAGFLVLILTAERKMTVVCLMEMRMVFVPDQWKQNQL